MKILAKTGCWNASPPRDCRRANISSVPGSRSCILCEPDVQIGTSAFSGLGLEGATRRGLNLDTGDIAPRSCD